jgi:hypothetical protein
VKNPIGNGERKYIAGLDPIEQWDRMKMEELRIPLQYLSPPAATTPKLTIRGIAAGASSPLGVPANA